MRAPFVRFPDAPGLAGPRGFSIFTVFSIVAVILAILTLGAGSAAAHGMRTAYVELEVRGQAATVRLRNPAAAIVTVAITGCPLTSLGDRVETDVGELRAFVAACTQVIGAELTVSGLGGELDEAVVSVRDELGREHTALLSARQPSFTVPRVQSAWTTAASYVEHGVRHIATGFDHLLLLILLVLQLVRLRPILVVETAFSISHGLAFAATSLGWIQLDPAPVEACIALSLILVALEVGAVAPSTRALAALALVFGAVHGLGFAGGLRELGVPAQHTAAALLGFGLGVELGQIVVVVAAWAALAALRRTAFAERFTAFAAVAGGALATFWLFDRVRDFFAGA